MVDTQIITLDGPSGCGKSTVTLAVAQKLGFHWLNSGALYRLVALEHTKKPFSRYSSHLRNHSKCGH